MQSGSWYFLSSFRWHMVIYRECFLFVEEYMYQPFRIAAFSSSTKFAHMLQTHVWSFDLLSGFTFLDHTFVNEVYPILSFGFSRLCFNTMLLKIWHNMWSRGRCSFLLNSMSHCWTAGRYLWPNVKVLYFPCQTWMNNISYRVLHVSKFFYSPDLCMIGPSDGKISAHIISRLVSRFYNKRELTTK